MGGKNECTFRSHISVVLSEGISLGMPFFAENPAKNPCSLSKL